MRAWDFFAHEVHHHHHYEGQFFWSALGQTDADLSSMAELDSQHDAMRTPLEKATHAVGRLHADPTAGNAATARTTVIALKDVLLGHLEREERDLEPISVAYGATEADKAGLRREIPGPVVALFGTLAGRRYRREVAPVWRSARPRLG